MKAFRYGSTLLLTALLVAGCEIDEVTPEEEPENPRPADTIQIDASSQEEWVFYDIDNKSVVAESDGWDLAFRRQWIASNGDAEVAVAILDDVAFDDLDRAPEEGYLRDAADRSEANLPEFAFHQQGGWYDYDPTTHQLSAKANRVYVVLSTEGEAYALRMVDYYDADGTPGHPSFEMRAIEAPENPELPEKPKEPEEPGYPEDAITVDATDEENWVYFDLAKKEVVVETESWDLAFRRHWVATNGEAAQVAILDGVTLDEVTEAPAEGFLVDPPLTEELLEEDLAFHQEDGWYAYDFQTHKLAPRERVYVVVTEGGAFAIQMLGYYDAEGEGGYPTFVVKELEEEIVKPVVPTEVVVDASSEEEVVYLDLDTGELTDADSAWDLAFRRYWIASNGEAGVEVALLDGSTLEEEITAPEEGYLVDSIDLSDLELTDEELKAGLAFHGESEWYFYDFDQHKLAPRDRVYVVISTEGRAFAIQMVDYYDEEGTSGFPTFLYLELE